MVNEFEELDMNELPPKVVNNEQHNTGNDLISSGNSGIVYDWSQAPEGVKAPPRVNLDGQIVLLKKAEIVLPPQSRPWEKTKDGSKEFKYVTFTLFYGKEGQQENISGMRVFNREGKYSHPTITRDRKNQASRVLGIYADYKKKDINECSLKEFMFFLNSEPLVKIIKMPTPNPETGAIVEKNMPAEFVNPQ